MSLIPRAVSKYPPKNCHFCSPVSHFSACYSYDSHCVKSVQIRSFSSPYSVQIRENTDQKKLRIWTHFTPPTTDTMSTSDNFQLVHSSFITYRKKPRRNLDWEFLHKKINNKPSGPKDICKMPSSCIAKTARHLPEMFSRCLEDNCFAILNSV